MSAGSTRPAGRDIVDPPLGASLSPGLAEQRRRFLLIRVRQFQVDGVLRAPLQQLDLDLADASADLKHGRAVDSPLIEELDHPSRRLVEPLAGTAAPSDERTAG